MSDHYNQKSGYDYDEKREYYSSSLSHEGGSEEHSIPPYYTQEAPPPMKNIQQRPQLAVYTTTSAPKAAFVSAPPPTPVIAQAVNFGDGASFARPKKTKAAGSIDWGRFSMLMHRAEEAGPKEKDSTWTKKEKSQRRKYTALGWIAVIVVLLGIGGVLYWHFSTDKGTTEPVIPSLGGFNGVSTTSTKTSTSSTAGPNATGRHRRAF